MTYHVVPRAKRNGLVAMRSRGELVGRRVLVITDEFVAAEFIAQVLARRGCTVLGTARTLGEVRASFAAEPPDVAVLDADLPLGAAAPAAAALTAHGVPFVVVTRLPVPLGPELCTAPRLRKPLQADWLVRAVARAVRARGGDGGAATSTG